MVCRHNKVTNISEDVITGVIDITSFFWGVSIAEKKHTFLGMTIELVKDGETKLAFKVT